MNVGDCFLIVIENENLFQYLLYKIVCNFLLGANKGRGFVDLVPRSLEVLKKKKMKLYERKNF